MATKRKSKTIRIPLMPLRGLMIFPHMVLHFDVGRPRSIAALDKIAWGQAGIPDLEQQDCLTVGRFSKRG